MKGVLKLLIISIPFLAFHAQSAAPKTLIFAVQPHDAQSIRSQQHNHNIVMKLAKRLNVDVEIYECPWARCVKAIENGDADIIDDLFFATDRAVYTHYLKPSYETQSSGFRFYADNTKTKPIQKWDDLQGLRVGFLRGYKHFPKFDESNDLAKVDIIDLTVVVKLMQKNRIDVFISPPSFDEKSFDEIDTKNKMMVQPFSHIEPTPLYLGISKKSAWYEHKALLENNLQDLVNL